MNIKQINYRKEQPNHLIWTIFAILFFSFSNNCYAQIYLDTYKSFTTEEEWSQAIDSLFHNGILDPTMDAEVLLMLKIDESGKVLSVHIFKSVNIDPKMFYNICATIEDRYETLFFKKFVNDFQGRLENGALRAFLHRDFPKAESQDKELTPIPAEKTNRTTLH